MKMMVCLAGIVYVVCLHEVPGVIVPLSPGAASLPGGHCTPGSQLLTAVWAAHSNVKVP